MIEASLSKNGTEFATNLVSEFESDLEKEVEELRNKELSLKRLKPLIGVVEKTAEILALASF